MLQGRFVRKPLRPLGLPRLLKPESAKSSPRTVLLEAQSNCSWITGRRNASRRSGAFWRRFRSGRCSLEDQLTDRIARERGAGFCFRDLTFLGLAIGRWICEGSDVAGWQDGLLWYKDSGQHVYVIKTYLIEVVVLAGFATEQQLMLADVIRKAYQATEEGFTSLVTKQWPVKPQIAAVGSCCLVGVICGGVLHIANLGDSRVVLGRVVKATGEVLAVQLSAEHNVGIESVRQELLSMHLDDKQIVVMKRNVWRVKGLIQMCVDQSDARYAMVSWPLFLLLGVFVPTASRFILSCAPRIVLMT
ncbi:hypothetical protein GW17_00012796 [Ensete ventricosum]|nr:hypothetical protein GW17_00012796 [Ensete ventricosum]